MEAANPLTAAWAHTVTGGTVLSGAGVHPGAGPARLRRRRAARDELRAVAPAPLALPVGDGVRAAAGLWPRADLPLTPRWEALVAGVLTADLAPALQAGTTDPRV
ncbi:hypothetical protein [Dactylosporangium sp. NPDC005555]|uniref:hypothetical protein n=1 Tax=Dactylosporangium sp. NPDC005555 TaxID=3154889 RepID=UPI0033BDE9C6